MQRRAILKHYVSCHGLVIVADFHLAERPDGEQVESAEKHGVTYRGRAMLLASEAPMPVDTRPRVIVYSPKIQNLSQEQARFLRSVKDLLQSKGLCVSPGTPESDTVEDGIARSLHSYGVVVLAFAQWNARRVNRDRNKTVVVPSEFTLSLIHISEPTRP